MKPHFDYYTTEDKKFTAFLKYCDRYIPPGPAVKQGEKKGESLIMNKL